MPIVKIEVKKRTHPFVIIDKRPLNDPRLSWAAKGLLAHLLCKPPDWRLVFANLLKQSPGGRYLLRALLNELKRVGYAKISRIRDLLGRMKGSSWTIYEEPTEMPVYPLSVKPESQRNQTLLITSTRVTRLITIKRLKAYSRLMASGNYSVRSARSSVKTRWRGKEASG
jgi:hypothetical protein